MRTGIRSVQGELKSHENWAATVENGYPWKGHSATDLSPCSNSGDSSADTDQSIQTLAAILWF